MSSIARRGDAAPPVVAAEAGADARFEALLRTIDAQRAELRAWAGATERWHRRYLEQLDPLLERRLQLDAALVELLDRAGGDARLARSERALLSELICELAAGLVAAGRAEFVPVLARHQPDAASASAAAADSGDPNDNHPADEFDQAQLRQVIAELFGLDDADLTLMEAPEALFAQAREHLQRQQAHRQQRQQQRQARAAGADAAPAPAAPSLRTLYRRLASSLHPDRARDAADAQRRTTLMQQLNAANQAGDLMGLLELQATLAPLEAGGDAAQREARLQQYGQALQRQSEQLHMQLQQAGQRFCADYGLDLPAPPKPQELDKLMARLKRGVADEIEALQHELRLLEESRELKRWLKWQRQAD